MTIQNKRSKRRMNRSELHKTYWLAIGWGLTIILGAWNYTSTAETNKFAAHLQESRDRAALAEMAAAAGPELLPPPATAWEGK